LRDAMSRKRGAFSAFRHAFFALRQLPSFAGKCEKKLLFAMRNVSLPVQNIYSSMQNLRKAQAEVGYGIAGDGYKSKPRRSSVELRRGLLNNYII